MRGKRILFSNSYTVCMQVDLSEPILSRFDILCVVRDTVEPAEVRIIVLVLYFAAGGVLPLPFVNFISRLSSFTGS